MLFTLAPQRRPAASGKRHVEFAMLLPVACLLFLSSSVQASPPPAAPPFLQITASGVAEPVSISGVVYQDTDRIGTAATGQRGLPGILVTLSRADDGVIVGGTTTGPDGSYAFDALPTGAYRVEHTPPPGWYQVRPASRPVRAHTVGAYTGVDFFDSTSAGPTTPWPTCAQIPIGPSGDLSTASGNSSPSMADDGSVAFLSDADLVRGGNSAQGAPGATQLFLWQPSAQPGLPGTITQLTNGASAKTAPILSRDGSVIAYIDDRPVTRGSLPEPNVYLISTTPDASGRYATARLTDGTRDGSGGYATPAVSNLTSGRYRVVFVKVVRGQQRILWVDVPAPLSGGTVNAALPSVLVSANSGHPSIDALGTRVAFAGPDGSGRSQISVFQFSRGGGTVTAVTAATNGLSTSPRISADGNAVAFESTANLVGKGNTDGNQEVFLYNIARGRITQITGTSSTPGHAVSNSAPSINANGSRVAFLSNASFRGSNPNGGTQICVWQSDRIIPVTNTALFDTAQVTVSTFDPCGTPLSENTYATGTVALVNGAPWISGDGTQVVFLSNANLAPDATLATPTTDNRDLSPEIFLASGF